MNVQATFRFGNDFFAVDLFAGGGGASEGIRDALGVPPALAVNHDPAAIAMHELNHPETEHMCASVFEVDPVAACRGRTPDLLWASPDCTHHSRAKGGKPRDKNIRALAWVVGMWARAVRPKVICLENVVEFEDWGPLCHRKLPIRERAGETFQQFVGALQDLGYHVEWKHLVAADYGAPTIRKRLFMVARCDGEPIVWPEPTHGEGTGRPWRAAAECIDWSVPCPSIFLTKEEAKAQGLHVKRPLADKTMARIAEGVKRYVIEAQRPFIVPLRGTSKHHKSVHSIGRPLSTVSAQGTHHALVAPYLVSTRNGERKGQRPRTRSLQRPMPTITAQGSQGGLAVAWLAKHYTGVVGSSLRAPLGTVTAKDHHSLVAAFLTKFYGSSSGQNQALDEPMHTIVTKARIGLVTVTIQGEEYAIVDIGMRMLTPRELARAQGFDEDYVLTGTKSQQIGRIGNSVSPPVARAVVAAQFQDALVTV